MCGSVRCRKAKGTDIAGSDSGAWAGQDARAAGARRLLPGQAKDAQTGPLRIGIDRWRHGDDARQHSRSNAADAARMGSLAGRPLVLARGLRRLRNEAFAMASSPCPGLASACRRSTAGDPHAGPPDRPAAQGLGSGRPDRRHAEGQARPGGRHRERAFHRLWLRGEAARLRRRSCRHLAEREGGTPCPSDRGDLQAGIAMPRRHRPASSKPCSTGSRRNGSGSTRITPSPSRRAKTLHGAW